MGLYNYTGPVLDLMLCCHHFGILNNNEQEVLHFSFCTEITNYITGPAWD